MSARRLASISIAVAGFAFFVLIVVVNPLTAKTNTASCMPNGGFGGAFCGQKYGGILPDYYLTNELVLAVMSLCPVAFGVTTFFLWK